MGVCRAACHAASQVFAIIDKKPQGKTCDAIVGITEEASEIMANAHNLLALLGGLSAALFTENKPNPSRKNLWLSLANGAGTYANSLRRALVFRAILRLSQP